MVKKKVFIATVAIQSAVVIVQTLIITRPFARRHEVLTAEDAILIAQAELVRRYGRGEILGKEFVVLESGRHWTVIEDVLMHGHQPRVDVRKSDGRAIVLWRDSLRTYWDIFVDSWFR